MNLADELAASMARRGMAVPVKPYAPIREPYRRPVPIDPDLPKRVKLSEADRAAIRKMRDAGVSWEEIEEQYPEQSPKHLRVVARSRRVAACVRCGARVETEKSDSATVVCARCIPEVALTCRVCGGPAAAGRERCTRCRKLKERVESLERMRALREASKGSVS